jgi:hypothetical protein
MAHIATSFRLIKKNVELTASGEVIDSVFEQGSVASSATAAGAINFEFSALSQDMFLEGVSQMCLLWML